MASNGKSERKYKPYTYYPFRQYDPILEKTLALIEDRLTSSAGQKTMKAFAEDANVSTTTLSNWKRRKVRRPSFSTVAACWAAAGRRTIDIGD